MYPRRCVSRLNSLEAINRVDRANLYIGTMLVPTLVLIWLYISLYRHTIYSGLTTVRAQAFHRRMRRSTYYKLKRLASMENHSLGRGAAPCCSEKVFGDQKRDSNLRLNQLSPPNGLSRQYSLQAHMAFLCACIVVCQCL